MHGGLSFPGGKHLRCSLAVLLFFLGVAVGARGQTEVSASPAPSTGDAQVRVLGAYQIGPGDVLDVRVFNRPTLSLDDVRVDGDGTIRLPLINDVGASCRSESELSAEIAARYREYLKEPQVDVYVKEYSSRPAAVIGAVVKPGSFQLERQVRLRELLGYAGGPSSNAGEVVQIIRDEADSGCNFSSTRQAAFTARGEGGVDPSTDAVLTVSLNSVLGGTAGVNPFISPGDIVNVPEADQVFVVGNVYKPSTLPLTDSLTVSHAIAMAGGVLANTKRSHIRIIRATPAGNTELFVDLEQIDRNAQPDLPLKAGDIVDVPTSLPKQILRGFIGGVLPAYAIYGPLTLIH